MRPRQAIREATREVLVFRLGGEEYGVDILKVQEIRGYDKVTALPSAPDFLKGVVNLRGTIVPVLDLRVKFGLPEPTYDAFTVVIVLRIVSRVIGIVVDGVSDVVQLTANEIKSAPRLGSLVDATYLAGLATQSDRMILLLDIESFLSARELDLLGGVTASADNAA
ncbi:MAG: chemotaxis protein CheW [Betaproteobacteria bacterium]|nr:chemotaxis protein CheW [Betaproteobacteria bacterium]